MTWSFEHVSNENYKEYSRNPLVTTDIEVRFHPILSIDDSDFIRKFQDGIRDKYPKYSEAHVTGVNISQDERGSQGIEIQNDKQHVFSNVTNSCRIKLTKQSLVISNSDHKNRKQLTSDFVVCLNCLTALLDKNISLLRIGVRYVNIIDKNKIAHDLSKNVDWNDVISEDFLNLPAVADISNANFQTELHSEMDAGIMVLRYGLVQNVLNAPDHFRFDIDRFLMLDGSLDEVEKELLSFTNDIYSLFVHVIGGTLREWMNLEER